LISRGIGPNKGSEIQALQTNTFNKKKKFFKRKGNKIFSNNANLSNKSYKKEKSKVQCYRCDKYGHTHRECPTRNKGQANIAETKKDNSLFFLALSSELNTNKNTWIIDSGASRHIIGFRNQFEDLEGHSSEEVTIGDNSTYPVKGIGTCSIKLGSGVTLHLKDVLFVPGIKRNLISISGLADQGYSHI
jgi:hypothetical protein